MIDNPNRILTQVVNSLDFPLVIHCEYAGVEKQIHFDHRLMDSDAFDAIVSKSKLPIRKEHLIGWSPRTHIEGVENYHTHRTFYALYDGRVVRIWILYPSEIEHHWLLGVFYGYPECCIQDHIAMLQTHRETGDTTPFSDRKRLIKKHKLPANGPMWCLDCIENFNWSIIDGVNKHRVCDTPNFGRPPSMNSYLEAILAWSKGELKPWKKEDQVNDDEMDFHPTEIILFEEDRDD
tara:strand:- start:2472 stop:3176 length:705 start_codon:yes stop_codon:yes gene_type:complete